jgi:hypothetical protein
MRNSFFVHVGTHKTGSTFLQRQIFPELPEIRFWDRPNFDILEGKKPTSLSRFMNVSPLVWRDLGKLLWYKLREGSTIDLDILLSDENSLEANDPFKIGQHLQEIKEVVSSSHDLRVLVVIRRQDTWFASAYAQMSDRWDEASQDHFENWLESNINFKKQFFANRAVRLRYFTLIRKMEDAVGRDCVTVLPYELLKSNSKSFIEQCCNFANRAVPDALSLKAKNKRSTSSTKWAISPRKGRYIQLRPVRAFQAVFGRSRIRIPDWRREKEISLGKDLSRVVLEKYKHENKKLDDHLSLDLKQYGYY